MVAVVVAGCSTPPTPTVVPPSLAELDQRAKAALAPREAFDALGGRFERDTPAADSDQGEEGETVANVCNSTKPLFVDRGTSIARSRGWVGGVPLYERVHAMSVLDGEVLVGEVRRQADRCTQQLPLGFLLANLPIVKPEGVADLYAYCQKSYEPDSPWWSCHAFLARDQLLAEVVVSSDHQDLAVSQLTSVVPIAAGPLVKA